MCKNYRDQQVHVNGIGARSTLQNTALYLVHKVQRHSGSFQACDKLHYGVLHIYIGPPVQL
jgi:hypothetical protein